MTTTTTTTNTTTTEYTKEMQEKALAAMKPNFNTTSTFDRKIW